MLRTYKHYFFDFDGVILDSMPIRTEGFRVLLEEYPADKVEDLIRFHLENGGWSRYKKIRYFKETLLQESCSEAYVQEMAQKYSEIVKEKLCNEELIINQTLEFITSIADNKQLFIVSGSDGNELRSICQNLGLAKYFDEIQGSPTPKNTLVKDLLEKYGIDPTKSCLIGDSKNDEEAARVNSLDFWGFNNPDLQQFNYIQTFKDHLS